MNQTDSEDTPLVPPVEANADKKKEDSKSMALLLSFLAMVVIGLGNKMFQKLQSIPMQEYPYFLSIYVTFIYIPLSFAYIFPMIWFGNQITKEQRAIPVYKFAIMGFLDGIAGIMQTFAVNFLDGSLVILLQQSAIPISMIISRFLLKIKYEIQHYIGALIVLGGLVTVLVPVFLHPDESNQKKHSLVNTIIWPLVMVLSCVPMTLSSVYKEKALGEQEIDVVYLNGWVAVFQFLISIPLAIPSAYAMQIPIRDIPKNFWQGARCYVGKNSLPGDDCHDGPKFVNLYIAFNVLYNILIILILKYGSSNILWLAMTIIVPLGFIGFSLHFMPGHKPLNVEDIVGLFIIMLGLMIYRFFGPIKQLYQNRRNKQMGYVAQAGTIQNE